MTWAALLLAAALLVGADRSRARIRAGRTAAGTAASAGAARSVRPAGRRVHASTCWPRACARAWRCRRPRRRRRRRRRRTGAAADRAADLLALGADPATAWSDPDLASRTTTPRRCCGWRGDRRPRAPRWRRALRSLADQARARGGGRGQRRGRAGLGADRRAAGAVLPACVPVPGHRAGRRRAGRRRVAVRSAVTADK